MAERLLAEARLIAIVSAEAALVFVARCWWNYIRHRDRRPR